MTALSALNTIHKTGLFGNYQNKEKSELTTVSEVKDIQIIQIVHYSKSTVKISSINLDNLKFPEEAMQVNSNNETRILWNGPNNWIVVSNNKEILYYEGNFYENGFLKKGTVVYRSHTVWDKYVGTHKDDGTFVEGKLYFRNGTVQEYEGGKIKQE